MIYLLTAIALTSGGSSTMHICTQKLHRTTQKAEYPERIIQIQISFTYKYILMRNKSKAKNLQQSVIKC